MSSVRIEAGATAMLASLVALFIMLNTARQQIFVLTSDDFASHMMGILKNRPVVIWLPIFLTHAAVIITVVDILRQRQRHRIQRILLVALLNVVAVIYYWFREMRAMVGPS